jgi:hypothetical protein
MGIDIADTSQPSNGDICMDKITLYFQITQTGKRNRYTSVLIEAAPKEVCTLVHNEKNPPLIRFKKVTPVSIQKEHSLNTSKLLDYGPLICLHRFYRLHSKTEG